MGSLLFICSFIRSRCAQQSIARSMDGWIKVPDVLLLHIYSYLSFNDKLAASSTCKHWRELLFHPLNWSHVNFCYFSISNDRSREKFLQHRTAHFINSCSVILPTEPQLLTDDVEDSNRPVKCGYGIDADVESLLQHLSVNNNLSKFSIIQSSPTRAAHDANPGKSGTNCSKSQKTPFGNNNDHNQDNTSNVLAYFTGIMTRSKSQKMRERNTRIEQAPHDSYSDSHNCDLELNLLSSRNFMRKTSFGSKAQ